MRDVAWTLAEPIETGRTVLDGTQYAALPVGQWRREVGRWFGVGLALLQQGMVEFVTGPAVEQARAYFADITGGSSGDMVRQDCGAQRVRAVAGVRNFDIRAVVIIVVLGGWIVLVGLSVDNVVGFAQRRWAKKKAEAQRLGWMLDGLFQTQRLAFEGAGMGGWKGLEANVPVTAESALPPLDATGQKHALPEASNGQA